MTTTGPLLPSSALSLTGRHDFSAPDSFVKGAAFSPDGSCVLVSSEGQGNKLSVLSVDMAQLEAAKYYQQSETNTTNTNTSQPLMSLVNTVSAAESVHDFKWYPFMRSSDPASNLFLTTSRDQPVQLWSAETGSVVSEIGKFN
jgi:WD40 repeat protein